MEKIRIRDGKNSDPGWKKFGSGKNIQDPQYYTTTVRSTVFENIHS
jgi:hypothetical protein